VEFFFHRVRLNVSKATPITAVLLITRVKRKEGKKYHSEWYVRSSGKQPAYPLEMTQCWNILLLAKSFFFVLTNQDVWVTALCVWVTASRRFEGTYRFHLQGYERMISLIALQMTPVPFLRRWKRITQPHDPRTLKNFSLSNRSMEI